MRGGVLALALLTLSGLPLFAQSPPAPAPRDTVTEAKRPEPKPETIPEAAQNPAPPAEKPAPEIEQPSSTGTPVEEAAPAEAAPADDTAPAPEPEPEQPPQRDSLRESDFDHSACLLTLFTLGAEYAEIPEISEPDNRDCGIARPIRITQILPGVSLQGEPVMRCDTARHLAFWLRDFVRPATEMLPGAPQLREIAPGSTYQCRGVIGTQSTANVSEHALGNALDIAAFHFDDGSNLTIAPRADSGDLTEAFQAAIRATACLYFTTVLGPGANAAHDDHLHLDIKARKGGYRLCQ